MKTTLPHPLDLKELRELHQTAHLLLACSGGADSICLFYHLLHFGISFEVAHAAYTHRESSGMEVDYLRELCAKHGVPFHTREIEMESFSEARARALRYGFFYDILSGIESNFHPTNIFIKSRFSALILGHSLDDRLEWLLMCLLRGARPSDMADSDKSLLAMPILEPLRGQGRDAIRQNCAQNKLAFYDDSANLDTKYLRNDMRLNVLGGFSARAPENIATSLSLLPNSSALKQSVRCLARGAILLPRGSMGDMLAREVVIYEAQGGRVDVADLAKTDSTKTSKTHSTKPTPVTQADLAQIAKTDSTKTFSTQATKTDSTHSTQPSPLIIAPLYMVASSLVHSFCTIEMAFVPIDEHSDMDAILLYIYKHLGQLLTRGKLEEARRTGYSLELGGYCVDIFSRILIVLPKKSAKVSKKQRDFARRLGIPPRLRHEAYKIAKIPLYLK